MLEGGKLIIDSPKSSRSSLILLTVPGKRSKLKDREMSKPEPAPIDPSDLPELCRQTMKAAKFPFLASMDGDQARLRPVSPVRTDGFHVYVANLRCYHKTGEISDNPKIELGYLAPNHDQVRITAVAGVVSDPKLLQDIWDSNPLLRNYLGSIENPELIIYHMIPKRVRFMREWALEYHELAPADLGE